MQMQTHTMNHLATVAQTMSSREIADLVESRHDKVKQSIERLATRGVIGLPPMGEYLDSLNRKALEYRIEKRDSYVIVAQLSPEFTARLVDRWQELEERQTQPNLPDFSNPAAAARAWADALEAQQSAQQEVRRLQDVCSTISRQLAAGLTIPEFCRQLNGVNIRQAQIHLAAKGYLRRVPGGFQACSKYRDTWFAQRLAECELLAPRPYVILTEKGARNLYALYLKNGLPMKQTWDGRYTHDLFGETLQ